MNGEASDVGRGLRRYMERDARQVPGDHFWNRLSEGGDEKAQQCGWLKDRFGVSWQVVPTQLPRLLTRPNSEKARKAMQAVLRMKKIDLEAQRRAVE